MVKIYSPRQSGFSRNRNILIDKTGIFTDSKHSVTTAFEVRRLVIYWADQISSVSNQLHSEWVACLSAWIDFCSANFSAMFKHSFSLVQVWSNWRNLPKLGCLKGNLWLVVLLAWTGFTAPLCGRGGSHVYFITYIFVDLCILGLCVRYVVCLKCKAYMYWLPTSESPCVWERRQ